MERPKTPVIFGDGLPQDQALRRARERLFGAVAELPLRYAPFFGRLSALWQVPEELVLRELTRAKEAKSWSRTLLPGLTTFDLALEGKPEGECARLLHFAPGVRFPKHRHRGAESVLVLEGSYADASGMEVRAGDIQSMPANSEHGIELTGPILRWASKLFG